jgi:phosphatidylethanolamine/phosphatidyl-N-methylethanolamine N-methyltransferase
MKPSDELRTAHEFTYKYDYEKIVDSGSFLSRWVYQKSHQTLESYARNIPGGRVLELGAQADQHRPYVKTNFSEYIVSDINLDLLTLQSKSRDSSARGKESDSVKYQQIDASNIPYPDNHFDRIIATCLIAHLPNAEDALYEWRRVVRLGGQIDFYVACEPGLLLRLARTLTHKRINRQSPYAYDLLEYSQHRNHFPGIHEFIKFVFQKDEIRKKMFPFRSLGWNLNLWAIFSIKVQK